MAMLDEWVEILVEHPQTVSGRHVSSAWQSLSELDEGIVNNETTLRDTIGTVNFMHKKQHHWSEFKRVFHDALGFVYFF